MSDFGLSDVNMDATTKKELQTFLEAEQAQQRVQENIHSLTNMCWDKERDCLHNCVGRFLDTSSFIIAKVQEKRSSAGVSS